MTTPNESSAKLMMRVQAVLEELFSSSVQNALAQGLEACSPVPLSLDELEASNLTLRLTLIPFQRQARLDSGFILVDSSHEGMQVGERALQHGLKPAIQQMSLPIP